MRPPLSIILLSMLLLIVVLASGLIILGLQYDKLVKRIRRIEAASASVEELRKDVYAKFLGPLEPPEMPDPPQRKETPR